MEVVLDINRMRGITLKKRTLKQELTFLYSIELLCAILFWVVYIIWTKSATRFAASNASVYYPLFIVSLILVEGSLYWFNCLKRVENKKSLSTQRIAPIYQTLKVIDYILIVTYIPVLFITYDGNRAIAVTGILIWLFSIIELVNYFHYRLSYYTKSNLGLQIIKPLKLLISGKATKSQIAKEILLYQQKFKK